MTDMKRIAAELSRRAKNHEIGSFRKVRKRLHPKSSSSIDLFPQRAVKDTYAFHWGGRRELQFNIGFEERPGGVLFRHGVAFSLEKGPYFGVSDVMALYPKIDRLNEFLSVAASDYPDMRIWFR